ncbi:DUF1366 domain-containing protein [Streptococcus suis]|uniref:DUF1366 domain-containing protein n=1 Tax=Streptococcus suis TaxID=1307 RepID=UPI000CF36664|nr:DUF1366 domain-containing protein [Streptococcus suis]
MDFIFGSKSMDYHLDGSPKHTRLVLVDELGSQIVCHLPADSITKSNDELVQEGADDIYNRFFPMRAENEKFNTIGERIAKFDGMIEEATKTIEKMKEQLGLSSASRSAFLRVVMSLYQKGMLSDEELAEMGLFDDNDVE